MRITESKLRRIIRSIILEGTENQNNSLSVDEFVEIAKVKLDKLAEFVNTPIDRNDEGEELIILDIPGGYEKYKIKKNECISELQSELKKVINVGRFAGNVEAILSVSDSPLGYKKLIEKEGEKVALRAGRL